MNLSWPPGMEPVEPPPIPESKPKPARVGGPIDIHITMDTEIGDPELDPETGQCIGPGATILDLIVQQAVTRLVPAALKAVQDAAVTAAQREVTDQVRVMVVDALTEPFQVTDRWGSKSGTPITVQELIATEVKAQLQPAKSNQYDRNTTSTTISDVIKSEVDTALRNELNPVIRQARVLVVDKVKETAAEMISGVVVAALKR